MSEHTINLDELAGVRDGTGHSVFSASSSAMWAACSGSLIPNLLAPDDAGEEAAEGTVAHMIGEEWLRSDKRPSHRVGDIEKVKNGDTIYEIEITEAMLDSVEEYYDWCWSLPGEHYVEQRVSYADLMPIPNQGGTCDHAACLPGELTITDEKYGKGERVYAENNSQLLLYAYGFFLEWDWLYDFQKITIRICQQRLGHFDVWETTREELLKFAEWIRVRARLAWRIGAPRTVSEKGCRWCKVKSTCAEALLALQEMTQGIWEGDDEFVHSNDDLIKAKQSIVDAARDILEPATLNTEQMAALLPFRQMYEGFFSDIEAELESRALAGETVPGYKLVESRSNRQWVDEDVAVFTLEESGVPEQEIYKKTVISPAQAEEAIRQASIDFGKKITKKTACSMIESITRKPPGRPTLVKAFDKRPELENYADDAFDD